MNETRGTHHQDRRASVRRPLLATAMALVAMFGAQLVVAVPASASPWDPTVYVTVRMRCTGSGTLTLSSPSIGTKKYAWSRDSSTGYHQVQVKLTNVPSGTGGGAPNGGKGTYLGYDMQCTSKVGPLTQRPRAAGTWGIARPVSGNNVNKVVCAYTYAKPCSW